MELELEKLVQSLQSIGVSIGTVRALSGAATMNAGALVEGLRVWAEVEEWGADEIALATHVVNPERLVNALAEQRLGAFGKEELGFALFAAGAVLGPRASEVARFFETAPVFLTRVVGCRFDDRLDVLEELKPGQRLSLVREPENPVDTNAIRVETKRGQVLGYVRRPIARRLSERVDEGVTMLAKVALLTGSKAGPNDRLYIEVKVREEGAEAQ